jgi:hypothetical protein
MKFRYAPVPREVFLAATSWTIKGRYACLLGMAFNQPTLRAPLEEIAQTWAEVEHEPPLAVEAVAKSLREMATLGWLTRRRSGQTQWVTDLLVRYDRDQPGSAPGQGVHSPAVSPVHDDDRDQPGSAPGQGVHSPAVSPVQADEKISDPNWQLGSGGSDPNSARSGSLSNTNVVGVDLSSNQNLETDQQQQLFAILTRKIASTMRGLNDRRQWEIWEERARKLAVDPWMTADRVWGWAYAIYRSREIRQPASVLAGHLARHEEPPRLPDHICRACWRPMYMCQCEDSDVARTDCG